MNWIKRLFRKSTAPAPTKVDAPKKRMMEFLVCRTDGDWFDLHASRLAEVLRPTSVPSHPIEGWGDHRIEVGGCEVSFSYEDPGIQISFESDSFPREEAVRIVTEIATSISEATGQGSKVIEL